MSKKKIIILVIALIIIVPVIFFGTIIYSGIRQSAFLAGNHTVQEKYNFCNSKKSLKDECFLSMVTISDDGGKKLSPDYAMICSSISAIGSKNACFLFLAKSIKDKSFCDKVEDAYYKDACQRLSRTEQESNSIFAPFIVESFNVNDVELKNIDLQSRIPNSTLDLGTGKVMVISGKRVIYQSTKLSGKNASLKLMIEDFANDDYSKAVDYVITKMHEQYSKNQTNDKTQILNYLDHEIYITKEKDTISDGVYSGTIGVGNILFPEYNIIVTAYFFDTPFYGVDLVSPENTMKKIVDNVIKNKK